MRAILITAAVAGAVGFVAGNAFWYLASPLWIDQVVSEPLVAGAGQTVLKSGQFQGADAVHKGAGTAELIDTGGQTLVRFTGFEVTNGPDLYVWLVKAGNIESSSDVKASEWLELGRLKGNIGDQNCVLPEGASAGDYGSVVIWCRQFGVLFAAADLSG